MEFCGIGYDQKTIQKLINGSKKEARIISNDNNNNIEKKKTIIFRWIPKIGPKTRKVIKCFYLE